MLKTLRYIASIGIVSEHRRGPMTNCVSAMRFTNAFSRCSAAPCASATSMPVPATAASLKYTRSTIPIYNIEGLGIRFVASPRHADLLLVTGPVSRHMESGGAAYV